jgi:hypothetical protein
MSSGDCGQLNLHEVRICGANRHPQTLFKLETRQARY